MASIQPNIDAGKEKLQDVKQKISEKANGASQKANETYENMKHMLNETGHNIQEQTEQLYDAMAKYVRENPMKAVGVAALAGCALAIMMRKMGD